MKITDLFYNLKFLGRVYNKKGNRGPNLHLPVLGCNQYRSNNTYTNLRSTYASISIINENNII